MKKTIFYPTVIASICGAYLITTGVNGIITKRNIESFNQEFKSDYLTMTKYDQGLFSSHVQYKYEQGSEKFYFDADISHGPFPISNMKQGNFLPVLSVINGEFKSDDNNKHITLTGTTKTNLTMGLHTKAKSDIMVDKLIIDDNEMFKDQKFEMVNSDGQNYLKSDKIKSDLFDIKNFLLNVDSLSSSKVKYQLKIDEMKKLKWNKEFSIKDFEWKQTINNDNATDKEYETQDKSSLKVGVYKEEKKLFKLTGETNISDIKSAEKDKNKEIVNTNLLIETPDHRLSSLNLSVETIDNLKNYNFDNPLGFIKNLNFDLKVDEKQFKDVASTVFDNVEDLTDFINAYETTMKKLQKVTLKGLKIDKAVDLETIQESLLQDSDFNSLTNYIKVPADEKELFARLFALNVSVINNQQATLDDTIKEMLDMEYFKTAFKENSDDKLEMTYLKKEISHIIEKQLDKFNGNLASENKTFELLNRRNGWVTATLIVKDHRLFLNNKEVLENELLYLISEILYK